MAGFPARWCVAGGWAIDLFLGRVTRPHADVELAVFREDQSRLRQFLDGWELEKLDGNRRLPWGDGEWLELPVHEIHARSRAEPPCAFEFLLNERREDLWVFRRRASITLPLECAILRSAAGSPVLAPEIALLYKAKSPRTRDEADFESARPAMSPHAQRWLSHSLAECHPGHPWRARLPSI